MKTDILIIGAGLTGLTTAYTLARRGRQVTVLEQMDRAGGQIHTHTEQGFVFESGPNTGTVSNPEVAELMADLEKTSGGKCRMETAPDASKRRLIWKTDSLTMPYAASASISVRRREAFPTR